MAVVLMRLTLIPPFLARLLQSAVNAVAIAFIAGASLSGIVVAQVDNVSLAGEQKVHVPIKVQATALEQPQDYFVSLLQMILEESKSEHEVIDIVFSPHDYSQARWINMVAQDPDDVVMWTMSTKAREQLMQPIRIPLFKGLFSYRVFLIRKGDQARFDRVKNLNQLRGFVAGQGVQWPDTQILMDNKLSVTTAEHLESLYRMLKAQRFDYFPRGVSEAWFEVAQRHEKDVVVEKSILLYYPAPMYFFVNKNNKALAARIELGFQRIIANGKFDEFFYQHARVAGALAALKNHSRRLFELHNPDLPDESLVGVKGYWLSPSFEPDAALPLAPK